MVASGSPEISYYTISNMISLMVILSALCLLVATDTSSHAE